MRESKTTLKRGTAPAVPPRPVQVSPEYLSPLNKVLFRAVLRSQFPWLASEEPVSGADAIDALVLLYQRLGRRP